MHSVQHSVSPRPSSSSLSGSSSATGFAHQRTGAGLALPNYQWIIEKLCVCPAEVADAQSPITTTSSSSSVLPLDTPHPPIKTRAAVIDLTTDSSSDDEDDENEVSHVGNSSSSSTVKLKVNETKAGRKIDATLSAIFDHNIDSLVDADPYSTKRKAKLPSLPVPTDGIYPPLINIPQITTRVLQPLRAKLNAALEKSTANSIYGYNPESIAIPMWPHQHCGHCNKWGIGPADGACPDCSCDIVECYDYAGLTDAVCKVYFFINVCYILYVCCIYTNNLCLIRVYATLSNCLLT